VSRFKVWVFVRMLEPLPANEKAPPVRSADVSAPMKYIADWHSSLGAVIYVHCWSRKWRSLHHARSMLGRRKRSRERTPTAYISQLYA